MMCREGSVLIDGLDLFEGIERCALRLVGLAERRHARLVQGLGAQAPAFVPQAEILFGCWCSRGTPVNDVIRPRASRNCGRIVPSMSCASAFALIAPSLN